MELIDLESQTRYIRMEDEATIDALPLVYHEDPNLKQMRGCPPREKKPKKLSKN